VRGSLGRIGNGPGEFAERSSFSAGWRADSLWVFDRTNARLTVFAPDRGFVRDLPVPALADQLAPTPTMVDVLAMYPGGDLLIRVAPRQSRPPAERETTPERLLRVTSEMQLRKEVAVLPLDSWRVYGIAPPFNPAPLLAVSPDGSRIAIATTAVEGSDAGKYRITLMSALGDTLHTRQHAFTPMPVPRSIADSVRPKEAALGALYGRAGLLAYPLIRVPPVYQPLSEILAGSDGAVWLRLRRSPSSFHWLLLDSAGAPVGTTDVEHPVAGSTSAIWSAQQDSNGTPQVLRYRLRGAGVLSPIVGGKPLDRAAIEPASSSRTAPSARATGAKLLAGSGPGVLRLA
jgi:hypothetical protein